MSKQTENYQPQNDIEIILKQDTAYQYQTADGVFWTATVPRGTVLHVPESWVREGVPAECLAKEKLI